VDEIYRDYRSYRDFHGRGIRQPVFNGHPPYYATPAGKFEQAVTAQIKRLRRAWPELFKNLECAVDDTPPSDPPEWEERRVMRSRLFPATYGAPARIVLYRRPIQARASSPVDLQLLVRDELVIQLANLSGRHPEDIDPQVMS
jgi:predicted Zn-dependent protease with MMP-like domain